MPRKRPVHRLTARGLVVARPKIGKPTVGVIAAQLAELAPDQEAAIERLRHWAREKLLVSEAGPRGTGKHRHFASTAPYEAATLTAIAATGLPVAPAAHYLTGALNLVCQALPNWLANPHPFVLEIRFTLGSEADPEIELRTGVPAARPGSADVALRINLDQIFRRIRQP